MRSWIRVARRPLGQAGNGYARLQLCLLGRRVASHHPRLKFLFPGTLVATFLLTSCAHVANGRGPLGRLPDVGAGIVIHQDQGSRTWKQEVSGLCMRTKGIAVLDSIEPVRIVGSVRLDRAGVHEYREATGAGGPGRLPNAYHPVAGYHIDQQCSEKRDVELAVQFHREESGPGGIEGFRLKYHVGGRGYQQDGHFWIVMCDPTKSTPESDPLLDRCRENGETSDNSSQPDSPFPEPAAPTYE